LCYRLDSAILLADSSWAKDWDDGHFVVICGELCALVLYLCSCCSQYRLRQQQHLHVSKTLQSEDGLYRAPLRTQDGSLDDRSLHLHSSPRIYVSFLATLFIAAYPSSLPVPVISERWHDIDGPSERVVHFGILLTLPVPPVYDPTRILPLD
jgi:hypothetical protein